MKNKNQKSILEDIRALGERYNSSLRRIGEIMDEVADIIGKYVPYNSFRYKNLVWYRDIFEHHPRWSDGPVFVYMHEEYDYLITSDRPPNSVWYHMGDYNCRLYTGTSKIYRKAAKMLPEFLEALVDNLKSSNEDAENSIKVLEKMIEAYKKEA